MGASVRPEEDEEERRRQQGASADGASGPQAAPPTFAMLQRQGYARPAPQQAQAQSGPDGGSGSGGPPGGPGGPPVTPGGGVGQVPGGHTVPPQNIGGAPSLPPAPGGYGGRLPHNPTDSRPQQGAGTPFGQHLQGQYENYQGPGAFSGQAHMIGTPVAYQPGQYGGQYNAVGGPMQRQVGQFSGQDPMSQQLMAAISGQLQNPSSFGQDAVQQMFNRLSGQIDDEYTLKDRGLQEDMARRGLADSSIRGGRMADLNVQKRSAKTELADRLLEQMALTGSQDRQAAIGQAMGHGQNQFGNQLSGYQTNMGASQQNFQQDLMARAFQGDQQAMQLVQNMNVQGFNNQAGQQGFQNQMQQAGFARDQSQQQYQNQLTNYQANLGAGQQGFNQQQALLSSLLGYEQQGFENAFQGAQFDADNDFRNRQLAAAMASLGL